MQGRGGARGFISDCLGFARLLLCYLIRQIQIVGNGPATDYNCALKWVGDPVILCLLKPIWHCGEPEEVKEKKKKETANWPTDWWARADRPTGVYWGWLRVIWLRRLFSVSTTDRPFVHNSLCFAKGVPTCSPSRGGDVAGFFFFFLDINQPSLPTPFFSCVYFCLWPFQLHTFHSINSPDNSLLSHCLIGPFNYISLYESLFQPWGSPLWLTGLKAPTN